MVIKNVIMFVKPALDEYCIVLSFNKDAKIYIHNAYTMDTISECIDKVKELIRTNGKSYLIDRIIFDAGIYRQEGFSLRRSTDIEVIIYTNKGLLDKRLADHLDWITKYVVFRETDDIGYTRFINMYDFYTSGDKYNSVVDILCDISRYYRQLI